MFSLFQSRRLFLLLVALILSLFLIAARPMQTEPPAGGVPDLVQIAIAAFTGLIGWPALLSVIIIALQYFGKLSTTTGETIAFWVNVVVFLGIFVLAILGKIDLVNQIDTTFGTLAKLLTYVLILLGAPLAFERIQVSTQRFRETRFFQARMLARVK